MKFFASLYHSILLGLTLFTVVLFTISYLLFLQTRSIHEQASADRNFLILLNTTLEVRRYEKTYLMFYEKKDFESILNYLDQTDHQLREYRDAFQTRPNGERILQQMTTLAKEYRDQILQYKAISNHDSPEANAMELSLHQSSKQLITLAEHISADNQDNISIVISNMQQAILIGDMAFLSVLFIGGVLFIRRAVIPLRRMQDGLAKIMEGRKEILDPPCQDQEFIALTRMFNLVMKTALKRREERNRKAQTAYTDTMLLRLVKTLGQPLTNISTACQIVLEEAQTAPPFLQEMVMQIRQQAEQSGRLLLAIQEYATPAEEPNKRINLSLLIGQVVDNLEDEQQVSSPPTREIPDDLEVIGNPVTLEQIFSDLIAMTLSTNLPSNQLRIKGCRRSGAEIQRTLDRSSLRPLVWLYPDCREVAEISFPISGDIQSSEAGQGVQDISTLCAPQDNGSPGICLMPGILRQHGGAMLAEIMQDASLLLRIWLPVAQSEEGVMPTRGE
ncbi:MAG: HAMP domain-containing histidine kinase [Magnetococcales bacterium]|nr:HAMP domain-containing histidine kinase [Magnetococcales bacterium]